MASACTLPASSAGKYLVNHTVALEPALSFEGFRHDIYAEMGFARPAGGPHVPMLVRFVDHLQALRRESL